MNSAVSQKGQVTIPKPIRDRIGIGPGSVVTFDLGTDGRVVIAKAGARRPQSRFAALRGRADKGLSTEEIMALPRGE